MRRPLDEETLKKAGLDEVRQMIRETDPPKPSTRLQTLGKQLTTVAEQRQVDPSTLCRSVHGDLDWVVMKALDKQRQRRYATANGLAMDLQRHLNNEPVVAGPPSVLYRAQKFVRRNRTVAIAGTIVALAVVTGLALAVAGLLKARTERNHAVGAEQRASAAATQLRHNLVRSDLAAANRLFDDNKSPEAIAHLARAVRVDPTYWPATMRLMSALLYRTFPREVAQIEDKQFLYPGKLSGDEPWISTWDKEGNLSIWSTKTGRVLQRPDIGEPVMSLVNFTNFPYVALRTQTGRIRIWDVENKRIASTPGEPDRPFSKDPLIAKGLEPFYGVLSNDGVAEIWNAKTEELHITSATTGERALTLEIAGEGEEQVLSAILANGKVGIWRIKSGTLLGPFGEKIVPTDGVFVSDDGKQLLLVKNDEHWVQWYDLNSGSALVHRIPIQQSSHGDLKIDYSGFSPDGKLVYVISHSDGGEGTVAGTTFDSETGNWVGSFQSDSFKGQFANPADGLQFGIYGAKTKGNTVTVWNIETGKVRFKSPGLETSIDSARFSPDGQTAIAIGSDKSVRFWNINSGAIAFEPIQFASQVNGLSYSPDLARILVQTHDNKLHVFDASNGRELLEPIIGDTLVRLLGFLDKGRRVLVHDGSVVDGWTVVNGRMKVFDLTSHTPLPFPVGGKNQLESGFSVLSDGGLVERSVLKEFYPYREWSWLLFDEEIRDAASGAVIRTTPFEASTRGYIPAQDDSLIALSSNGFPNASTINILDTESGSVLSSFSPECGIYNSFIRFSSTGRFFCALGNDGNLRVWNTSTGKKIMTFPVKGQLIWQRDILFSPDDRILAMLSDQGLEFKPLIENKDAAPIFLHDARYLEWGSFSPDSKLFAVGAADNLCRVYDVHSGKLICALDHQDWPRFNRFSDDGHYLITEGAADMQAPAKTRIWDLSTKREIGPPATFDGFPAISCFLSGRLIIATSVPKEGIRLWDPRTGLMLNDRPDGRWLPDPYLENTRIRNNQGVFLTYSEGFDAILRMDYGQYADRCPMWVADMAERLGGLRLNSSGVFESVEERNLDSIRQTALNGNQDDIFVRLAKYILATNDSLSISPYRSMSRDDYVKALDDLYSTKGYQHLLTLSPNNGVVLSLMAIVNFIKQIPDAPQQIPDSPPHWLTPAEYLSDLSIKFSPDEAEVWWHRAEIKWRLGKREEALFAIKQARELGSEDSNVQWLEAMTDPEEQEGYERYTQLLRSYRQADATERKGAKLGYLFLPRSEALDSAQILAKEIFQESSNKHTPFSQRELKWLNRFAYEEAPDNPDVQILHALTSLQLKLPKELEQNPMSKQEGAVTFFINGVKSHESGDTEAAVASFKQAYRSLLKDTSVGWIARSGLFNSLKQYFHECHEPEWEHISWLASVLPMRDPRCTEKQIDLTPYYNGDLNPNGWAELPKGLVVFPDSEAAGFDVRGMINLRSSRVVPAPESVSGIRIDQRARKLHFLQASYYAGGVVGTKIAFIEVHYQSGRPAERYYFETGENTGDWWHFVWMAPPTEAKIVWHGQAADTGQAVSLFEATWENPHPDDPITYLDYKSTMQQPAHFIIAITAE